jgi:Cys-rich protein (TIGR01571 family)
LAQAEEPTAAAALAGMQATDLLKSFKMSSRSIELLGVMSTGFKAGYIGGQDKNIPCGSGINTTHFDELTYEALGIIAEDDRNAYGDAVCEGDGVADFGACVNAWNGTHVKGVTRGMTSAFPKCPETVTADTKIWGTCKSHLISCGAAATYFGDTNKMFMDWWTIFYWAWWITWAPFVGFFVAMISRGRTIREVIVGGFVAPTLFAIMWFSVFGGLAIKMERTAELALQVRPDYDHAMVTCSEHYSGGVPITPEAKKLAAAGYYMLTCIPKDDQIYRLMEPYSNLQGFLHFFLWIGLVIYFLTSSDSGSMVDDIIGASGLSPTKIPWWQKVFWCFTEGVVAIALIYTGGALKALQQVSIIIGLPFTILLCLMVPSTFRALKREAGDEDLKKAYRFNTQLLDFFEGFQPNGGSPHAPMVHITAIIKAIFLPFSAINRCYTHVHPGSTTSAFLYALFGQAFIIGWFALQIAEVGLKHVYVISWLMYLAFACILFSTRLEMRHKYNVYGSPVDDIVAAVFMWPLALAQCDMMAMNEGAGAPLYLTCVDEICAEMAAAKGAAVTITATEVTTSAADKV